MAENDNPQPQAPQQQGRKWPWRKGKRQGQLNPAPSGEQAVVEPIVPEEEPIVLQDGTQPDPAPVLDSGLQPGPAPVVDGAQQPTQPPVRQFFPVDPRGVELQQKGAERLAALKDQWAADPAGGQQSGPALEATVDPEGERDEAPADLAARKLEALKAKIAAERAAGPEPERGATFEDLTARRDPQRRLLAAQTQLRQRFDRLTREGAFKTPADAEFERDRINVATQFLDYLWQANPHWQEPVAPDQASAALSRVFAMSFVDWRRTFSFASTYGKDTLMVRKARQLVFDILVGREV
jgi:hypothetical protein